jgi:hypothetical protein
MSLMKEIIESFKEIFLSKTMTIPLSIIVFIFMLTNEDTGIVEALIILFIMLIFFVLLDIMDKH